LYEYELEAEIQHEFLKSGCPAPAYNSIIGSGANACILHYVENNKAMQDGDLVLIDAGGELDHYAADITRTFPVNGKFSPEQKAVYQLVLDAQLAAIATVKPGAHWNLPHETVINVLVEGLAGIGAADRYPARMYRECQLSPIFYAPHRALARHGCARCGGLQGGQPVARVGAGHGDDG
jgi:Xaa-Pro aminopeptidase